MKKFSWLLIFLLFVPFYGVNATSVSNIDMDIYIDNEGSAHITETWTANVTDGTEGYHPYYNYGDAEFSDLSVSMDGKIFEIVDDWNIHDSFDQKKYLAGFYKADSNELDICFGISDYGIHEYVMKYTIKGFVVQTSDNDMVYWNLFPKDFSASPNNVSITIHSDFNYDSNLPVWGYGKRGAPCYVYDGKIYMTSDGESVSNDEYMTILVKFDKGTFNTYHEVGEDFNHYYEMAQDGAVSYSDNSNSLGNKILSGIYTIFAFLLSNIWIVIVVIASLFGAAKSKNNSVKFGNAGNKVRKDVPNFREIPCNKDIYRAYWVSSNYNLNKKKEDFLGTVILKWLRNGNVRIEKVETKKLFKTSIDDNVVFEKAPTDSNELEIKLYNWMYEASRDGKLEKNEFKSWCSNHYSKILKWFDEVIEYENKMLVNEGKASIVNGGKVFKYNSYLIDDSMMVEAEQMAGLKKFLKEFTLIKEREPIEVNLWDEYLMFAQIFGIANEVASQFKKLYPEVIQNMESYGFGYDDIIFIHMVSHDAVHAATTARERAQSYSSGGGGFSSGGGGGGSFGGGGGGGGFR